MKSNLEIIESTGALANLCPQNLEMLKQSGNKLGGRLCAILRHRPETIGVSMDGLRPMERNKVHLSVDMDTAKKVAKRRKTLGNPVILHVNAEQMEKDGVIFYLSDNNIWMVDYVASKYLSVRSMTV